MEQVPLVHTDVAAKRDGFSRFLWVLTSLTALLAGIGGIGMFAAASSAPQEAVAAAWAAATAIVPYVFCRAFDEARGIRR